MSIEGITLENLSAIDQEKPSLTLHSRTCHSVFHSFMYNNINQYSATTAANSKLIMDMLKKRFMVSCISKIWDNTYGCEDHYICDTA